MDEVYVTELVTTGNMGYPKDEVAEVAICRMLADGSDFDLVYNDAVALDPRDLGKDSLDFLQQDCGMEPEELYAGEEKGIVAKHVQDVLFGKECTSYNVGSTYGKYLCFEPWDLTRNATMLPSISARLPIELKGPPEREHELIRLAYDRMCPGDPAEVGDGRRAIHLAQMAVSIMMVLRREGWL